MKNVNKDFEKSLRDNNLLDRFIAAMFYATVVVVVVIVAIIFFSR